MFSAFGVLSFEHILLIQCWDVSKICQSTKLKWQFQIILLWFCFGIVSFQQKLFISAPRLKVELSQSLPVACRLKKNSLRISWQKVLITPTFSHFIWSDQIRDWWMISNFGPRLSYYSIPSQVIRWAEIIEVLRFATYLGPRSFAQWFLKTVIDI